MSLVEPKTIYELLYENIIFKEPLNPMDIVKKDIDLKYEKAFTKDNFLKWYQENSLRQKSYTFIIFGPPRVGKSTLVSAITGKETTTNNGMEQGTLENELFTVEIDDNKLLKIYDTPGIEISSNAYNEMSKASQNSNETSASELLRKQLNKFKKSIDQNKPICAIFCISSGANFNIDYLKESLLYLQEKKILSFYFITNMYNLGNNSQVITNEMIQICEEITGSKHELIYHPKTKSSYYKFETNLFGLKVNSIKYSNLELGVEMDVKNIDLFFDLCIDNINPDKVLDFMRCTYKSEWFPKKIYLSWKFYKLEFYKWWTNESSKVKNE